MADEEVDEEVEESVSSHSKKASSESYLIL